MAILFVDTSDDADILLCFGPSRYSFTDTFYFVSCLIVQLPTVDAPTPYPHLNPNNHNHNCHDAPLQTPNRLQPSPLHIIPMTRRVKQMPNYEVCPQLFNDLTRKLSTSHGMSSRIDRSRFSNKVKHPRIEMGNAHTDEHLPAPRNPHLAPSQSSRHQNSRPSSASLSGSQSYE